MKTRTHQTELGYSILISAYKAEDYIEEALDSILKQDFNKEPFEILIGIDNCQSTLNKLDKIKDKYKKFLKVFYFSDNRGWAQVRNSLFYNESKYDKILSFDADDIMLADHVKSLTTHLSKEHPFVRARFRTYITNTDYCPYGDYGIAGNHFIAYSDFIESLGAWIDWPISADSEFLTRVKNNGFDEMYHCPEDTFLLRVHKDSLTNKSETRNGSAMRNKYKQELAMLKFIPKKYNTPLVNNLYKRLI